MKKVGWAQIVVILFFCGCVSADVRRDALRAAQSANDSLLGEVNAGCFGYFAKTVHWPKTTKDVLEGLKFAKRAPRFLSESSSLVIAQKNDVLKVRVPQSDGSSVEITFASPYEIEGRLSKLQEVK